jgi:hypothetical protein
MTGTNCDLFTHKQSRSYLNHLVFSPHSAANHHTKNTQDKATFHVSCYIQMFHVTSNLFTQSITFDLIFA